MYNYFCAQRAPEDRSLFAWEKDGWIMKPTRPDGEFARKVAACYYKQTGDRDRMQQVTGDDQYLVHNF